MKAAQTAPWDHRKKWRFSTFEPKYTKQSRAWIPGSRVAEQPSETWLELIERFSSFKRLSSKAAALAWSPATYSRPFEGGPIRRGNDHVHEITLLGLDFDDFGIYTLANVLAPWAGVNYIAHTSYSHTEARQKWRVIVPLAEPISPVRWSRVWEWLDKRAPARDMQCSDAARLFYSPACAPGGPPVRVIVNSPGRILKLCPDAMPESRAERAWNETTKLRALDWLTHEERIEIDPAARVAIGVSLGGSVHGIGPQQRVKGLTCPRCARGGAWFRSAKGPVRCAHLKTCGWYGNLRDL